MHEHNCYTNVVILQYKREVLEEWLKVAGRVLLCSNL